MRNEKWQCGGLPSIAEREEGRYFLRVTPWFIIIIFLLVTVVLYGVYK